MFRVAYFMVRIAVGFAICVLVRSIDFGNAYLIFHFLEPKSEFVKGFRTDDGWSNDASVWLRVVFHDLQDCLCLVVEFRANMPSHVIVSFIEVQHGLNVDILLAGPLHQVAYKFSRLR